MQPENEKLMAALDKEEKVLLEAFYTHKREEYLAELNNPSTVDTLLAHALGVSLLNPLETEAYKIGAYL